jgi:hypothetical protein
MAELTRPLGRVFLVSSASVACISTEGPDKGCMWAECTAHNTRTTYTQLPEENEICEDTVVNGNSDVTSEPPNWIQPTNTYEGARRRNL